MIRIEIANQFELLYYDKKRVNQRRSYDLHRIYPIAEYAPNDFEVPFTLNIDFKRKEEGKIS